MASSRLIRGALLEEGVLFFHARSGFEMVTVGADGLRAGRSGQELQGRGCWHQIDAIALPKYSPAFIYPVRLLVEAKCYERRPVDIKTVRAALGTVMDVNQNYFTPANVPGQLKIQRYNYAAAIFSTSGFTEGAQQFAIAHQIFLIEYESLPAVRPIVAALFRLEATDFHRVTRRNDIRVDLSEFRLAFREFLASGEDGVLQEFLRESGVIKLRELRPTVRDVPATYAGMIEGVYPVHLFASSPVPPRLLRLQREIPCEIRVEDGGRVWAFEPSDNNPGHNLYFRLEFQLPGIIAGTIANRESGWRQLVDVKRNNLRFVDVTGVVGERTEMFRLTLDQDWLARYADERVRIERRRRIVPGE
jgi:hypothetical protein